MAGNERAGVAGRLALTGALVTAAAAVVSVGAFAVFTDTQTVDEPMQSGTLTLDPVNVNSPNNRLSIGATNLAAGDTIERAVDVRPGGSLGLSAVSLTTTASPSSLLDTDATNGLQLKIEKCSVPWTEAGPPYTYTCSGTTTTVLASRAVIGANLDLTNLTLSAGAHNYLRSTLTLPSAAPNTLQGQTSTIRYAFTATQRAATSQ
jgi:predicted ribosomally synthesized peptide with SipW-like signal peptide